MPVCYDLTPRHDPEHGPQALAAIDKVICDHFKAECHPKHWYYGWHDGIGFLLAIGKTFAEIKAHYLNYADRDEANGDIVAAEAMIHCYRITCFLDANYIPNNWREWKH